MGGDRVEATVEDAVDDVEVSVNELSVENDVSSKLEVKSSSESVV